MFITLPQPSSYVLQVFVIDDLRLLEAGPPIVAAAVKQNNFKSDDGEKEKVKLFPTLHPVVQGQSESKN